MLWYFCRIIIWRHGGGKLFSYVSWHYENLSSCMNAPFTSIHILSLLLLEFFSVFFSLTSRKTGNQVCIISLFLLVSYCIHYPAEYLHLWCIPAVQRELQFLTQQPKFDTMPGFNGGFIWLSRSSCLVNNTFFMRITRKIVGGGMFYHVWLRSIISPQWGRDQRLEGTKHISLQVE